MFVWWEIQLVFLVEEEKGQKIEKEEEENESQVNIWCHLIA